MRTGWGISVAAAVLLAATLAISLVSEPSNASDAEGRSSPSFATAPTNLPRSAGAGGAEAFSLPVFPIDLPGVDAYDAAIVSALDHSGEFYTQCCDTTITAFTGESVTRGAGAFGCPAEPIFPQCFFTPNCICGYTDPEGDAFFVNGNYQGAIGPATLLYDGHAGYDYGYASGTPLVATRAGQLCKAIEDSVNGERNLASGWDAFHTFYIDHGTFSEGGEDVGYASWYLHATDLDGVDTGGAELRDLEPGECAPVAEGQRVAVVGNFGTFLPHLHFEVRVYDPLAGPEAFPRVVDPYGWTGAEADPWAAGGNAQALSRLQPLWVPEPAPACHACAAVVVLGLLSRCHRPSLKCYGGFLLQPEPTNEQPARGIK